MSTQEGKLKAIADAIRQKEGTTEPIPANSFASRILALEAGGAPEGVCTINLTASDPDGGTVEGGGVASRDMTITVDAKVNAQGNFYFDGWEENGEVVSEEPQYTFPVTADRNLTALFLEAQYVAGVDWWEGVLPKSATWISVTYGDGKFVAVGVGTYAAFSIDGKTWRRTALPKSATWFNVTYGDGKFVAVIEDPGNIAAYSEDGISWTQISLPGASSWRGVTYGDGKFVAVGNYCIGYSKDGITWTLIEFPSKIVSSVTYGEGKFVAVINSSNIALYSSVKGPGV